MLKVKSFFSLLTIAAIATNALPSLAIDTSSIPACQFSGAPSTEQLAACQAAAAALQGAPSENETMPSNPPADMTGNIPSGIPNGNGPDMSAFLSKLPQAPAFDGNGVPPSFMGRELSGDAEGGGQAAGQIGAALAMIREKLLMSEEGVAELKGGGIKIGDLEETLKQARIYYDKAQDSYAAGDYAGAGQYLQQMQGLNLQEKFAALESKAISADLIADIRAEMKNALKSMQNIKTDDSETDEIKALLMSSLEKLDLADAALKKKDTKGAAQIMKELRASAPQDRADGEAGKFKGMSKKMMGKILGQISSGLKRGEKGMNNAKAHGVEVSAAALELMAKAKTVYEQAQELYDKEDYAGAATKMAELQKMNLEEEFSAFKKEMLPPERMKSLAQMVADGIKALELTIEHTKSAGYDTTELEVLLTKVKNIYSGATDAIASKDIETFLSYMDEMDALDIAGQVDAVIRKLANAEIKELVASGLEKMNNVITALEEAIEKLAAKKIDTSNAKAVLSDMKIDIAKAQEKFDADDHMSAGKLLDNAVDSMISLINITRDSGISLAAERMKQINEIIALGNKGNAKQMVISPDKVGQLDQIYATVGNDEAMDMKQAFMQFDPELMDKVVAQRQKNSKYMNTILKDVMPLIPAADREIMLEGKTGLLEEMAATDKTIAGIKRIKNVSTDVVKALEAIKEQIKVYNFEPSIAEKLEKRMADFNDKIQSGEIKDPKIIANYIKVLQEETAQAIKESLSAKLKKGFVPAKNIDDNNPYFDEIKQLKNDGAISADTKGEINLNKRMNKKEVTDMINKTIDEKALPDTPPSILTINDVGNMVFNAYDIKPNIDTKNPAQMTKFLQEMGVDIKESDLKGNATLAKTADIVAAADDRWGKTD